MASNPEPGSNGAPVARKALNQTRNVRDLNTRLQMFVQSQNQKKNEIRRLKEENARLEMESKAKLQQHRDSSNSIIEKMRTEMDNLRFDQNSTAQELTSTLSHLKSVEDRLIDAESQKAELKSLCGNLTKDNERHKADLDALRKSHASLKYKYDSFELERKGFEERDRKAAKQNELLLRKLSKAETDLKAEKTTWGQVVVDKNEEIEEMRAAIGKLEKENESTQQRLREEFDTKLGEFVTKREEQYRLEKEEWMRIFKDEFNRKLSSYKTANLDLGADNKKKEGDLVELRTRISKLKQQKTELEVVNRDNDDELEKLRTDLDDLRRTKDEEVKAKNQQLHAERDRYAQKEIEFDELAGVKMQLDAEIELYRSILNEAEEACGYMSPLDARNRGSGARNSRKRRRFNNMTPMGPLKEKEDEANPVKKVVTPGVERAAKQAQSDLKALESADEEMKDEEDSFDVESASEYVTPGDVEGAPLQFSGLDLNKGMIEVQNTGEHDIDLTGYCLSNATGTSQYELPKMSLQSMAKVRIYVGTQQFELMQRQQLDTDELVGDYDGTYVFWGRDVWTGKDTDCARLYNPQQREVAIMEISPEMVGHGSKNGCLVM